MSSHVFAGSARALGSTMTAVVVAAGLVAVAPEPLRAPLGKHQVQVIASVLSAAEHSFPSDSAAATVPAAVEAPTVGVARAVAAAEGDTTVWQTPLGFALIALNFVSLPIWFLLMPITLPLSMFASAGIVPQNSGSLGSLLFLAGTGIIFLTGPLGALNAIYQGIASRTSASASTSRRNAAAAVLPASAATDSTPAVGIPDTEQQTGDRTTLTDRRSRARAQARPHAATAVAPQRSAADGIAAASGSGPRASSSVDDSAGKSRAQASSRR